MARITLNLTISDEDIQQGWNGDLNEVRKSLEARLSEVYGDDGGAYVPSVWGFGVGA